MAEQLCECGRDSHTDQITKYPVGTRVILLQYGEAIVREHCDDGRAAFLLSNGEVRTFHAIDSWVASVELPPVVEVEYPMLAEVIVNQGERIKRMEATIERLRAELESEQARTICAMCGEELTRMATNHGGLVTWQPMDDCVIADDRVALTIYGRLLQGMVDGDAVFIVTMPDDVRLCRKVTP